ncbi:MAG: transcription elongation factor GreA [Chitinophagales bacterium]
MEYLYMSQEGYDELKEKLDYLKNVKRKEISNDIAVARDKGDLSENAEYHAAKEEQSLIETKIVELEDSFARARVMDRSKIDTTKAIMLSKVKIRNTKNNFEVIYQLVSHAEADVKAKKISIDSPIGKGLLGTEIGDKVKINVPAGEMEFEILDIEF